ncbi:MAG: hypothetical protein CVV02_03700 [Firmicutes bacterium HGW-Firmicutes-7]|nr:MAG: hypothetical protein CVV02_03700 [Firmicutes bacterium HGW-Firmicutes-7]
MKKLLIVLAMVLMFSSTMVINAAERTTPNPTPEDRSNGFLSELEEKQDARFDEAQTKWTRRQTERQTRNDKYLEIVAQFSPDLLSSYEAAFDTHDALHAELFTTRTRIRTTYSDETKAALEVLKSDLFAQATAGEITWKEARESLKTFLKDSKTAFTTLTDAYKAAILDENSEWEAKVVEIKALHQELRAAIEAEDTDSASAIIDELYDYLLQHIEFDQFKLDTMNAIF